MKLADLQMCFFQTGIGSPCCTGHDSDFNSARPNCCWCHSESCSKGRGEEEVGCPQVIVRILESLSLIDGGQADVRVQSTPLAIGWFLGQHNRASLLLSQSVR